eukprot:Unigene7739_Nuclearia_a/m.23764 Unigene7739_Nuclearia_a/g.23764  ORF Unigene7739_Nuclearia_a/g.23764 Unigene7739_Nuclearia_a/m.23764 type:complete len:235 (+) Unigene7739_Nuclearia_a:13-717(+)
MMDDAPSPPRADAWLDDARQAHEPAQPAPRPERTCRICLGGVAEEAELGRLFSPCRCKGSMKYVHVRCLDEWRNRSTKREVYFQCDLCHFRYNINRSRWAQMLTRNGVLFTATLLLIFVIIFVSGFAVKLFFAESLSDFLTVDLNHMIYGSYALGLGGFVNLLVTISGGHFLVDFLRPHRAGTSNADNWKFLLVVIVIIGIIRAVFALYQVLRDFARERLTAMGDSILEVPETQ